MREPNDWVGRPLAEAIERLAAQQIQYLVKVTQPSRRFFALLEQDMYVLRQNIDENGVVQLVAGAKMGRENNNGL